MIKLHNGKERVYNFIVGHILSNGEAPTIMEIGKQFGLTSTSRVHGILVSLERDGLIKRSRRHRGIEIVKHSTPMVGWLDR